MKPVTCRVYFVASARNGTLYVGLTNDLGRRAFAHRDGRGSIFTVRYGVCRLVWYEPYDRINEAIIREKRIKKWNRAWKIRLIEEMNPASDDLYETLWK